MVFITILVNVFLVLCTNFDEGMGDISTLSEVNVACVSKWQNIELILFMDIKNTANLSKLWSDDEKKLKALTVQRLSQTVVYPTNLPKTFTCYGNLTINKSNLINISYDAVMPYIGIKLTTIRFIAVSRVERHLEFYLEANTALTMKNINYELHYCEEYMFLDSEYICPNYRNVKFDCVDLNCKASTLDEDIIAEYTNYQFYINTTNNADESQSISHVFHLYTKGSADRIKSEEPGHFNVIIMGKKPSKLEVTTLDMGVTLKWRNEKNSEYDDNKIRLFCKNGFNITKYTKKEWQTTFRNKTWFTPNTFCSFCFSYRATHGALWSDEICNSTIFPEKNPQTPPEIMCNAKTCESNTFPNKTRDITVICKFPEKKTQNGVLKTLLINYWDEAGNGKQLNTTNLTSCKIKLSNLSPHHIYTARMAVCNSKGCSPFSDSVVISEARFGQRGSLKWFIWGVPVIILSLIVLVGVVVILRCKEKSKPNLPLPDIQEPNVYENIGASIDVDMKMNDYNELEKDEKFKDTTS